jgi:ABC-type transport system involved in multi-copper enzyme maturation permease subunit
MRKTKYNSFYRLVLWELQEYLNFPILEILVGVAIYSVLNQPIVDISSSSGYSNLHFGLETIFFFMILSVGALVSRSFGASISKGEIKTLLSYPLKRWQIFVSKFTALFAVLLCIYAGAFSVQIYLLTLNFYEPMFYVSVLSFALQLLLMCSVTTIIVLLVKSEVISIFASILLLYGIENVVSPKSALSYTGRFDTLFGYFSVMTHGTLPVPIMEEPTLNDVLLAVSIPIAISALLLVIAVIYFVRVMEID